MEDFNYFVEKYKEQLAIGHINVAYTYLVKYMARLSSHLSQNVSNSYSFGSLFQGYMDYTYFYYTNDFLKQRKLKLGLVLNHQKMQFEIWLLGQTIPIQNKYWNHFKHTKWNQGRTTKPQYSILETIILEKPNFNNLEELTRQITSVLITVSKNIITEVKISKLT